MATHPSAAIFDPKANNPFAQPRGMLGRIAGRIMLRINNQQQQDAVGLVDVQSGDRVLEVGYGPGGLIRLLAERTEAASIVGVDPSPTMRDQAGRYNRAAVRTGKVRLDLGTADRTGLPDASVDHAVSVNNVAIWPDLDAGIRELHRVVRPGGTLVIAWHGGTSPSRVGRRLRLPDDTLNRISGVSRTQRTRLDVFTATR